MAVTISDVGKLAGVSGTTVSLCFQDSSRISDTTREKVLAAAKELGYVPNQLARRLRSGKSRLIATVATELDTSFMAEIMRGIEVTATEHGYNVLIFNSFRDAHMEKGIIETALEMKVEGLIVAACEVENPILDDLCTSDFPLAYIDSIPKVPGASYVINDMESICKIGMEYLLDLGHRRILLVNGPDSAKHFSSFAKIEKFYKETLQRKNIAVDESLILYSGMYIDDGYKAVSTALDKGIDFTAVFAVSDLVALGVIDGLERRNLSVPGDISVLGIDDSNTSSLNRVSLTTIGAYNQEVVKEDMGTLAAQILMRNIKANEENRSITPERVLMKPRLVERSTCRRIP